MARKLCGMRFLRKFLPFFLVVSVSCLTGPSTEEPYPALPEYPQWWVEVENCSGLYADFGRLRFFLLVGQDSVGYRARSRGRDIWVRADKVGDRLVLEHEMLHSLIGDGGHTQPVWTDCGLWPL